MQPKKEDFSGFRVANVVNAISVRRLGHFTAERLRARRKEFFIKKYSGLCELWASVVNVSSQKIRKSHFYRGPRRELDNSASKPLDFRPFTQRLGARITVR